MDTVVTSLSTNLKAEFLWQSVHFILLYLFFTLSPTEFPGGDGTRRLLTIRSAMEDLGGCCTISGVASPFRSSFLLLSSATSTSKGEDVDVCKCTFSTVCGGNVYNEVVLFFCDVFYLLLSFCLLHVELQPLQIYSTSFGHLHLQLHK